ncbi:MAG: hypothetical protein N0E54_17395 [Candidatus Thiodiazotropha taylori]|nr:hypothetical protein [Candidatus Thiodiazotropha endolucinida]MCW4230519.1 hypothetical protein [Candidatus Thiodiazotropha taylori]
MNNKLVNFAVLLIFSSSLYADQKADLIEANWLSGHRLIKKVGTGTNSVIRCNENEVVVGIHWSDRMATCARLGHGYKVGFGVTVETYPQSSIKANQVSNNPTMLGCPDGYLIQEIRTPTEFVCVPLLDSSDKALTYSKCNHDGRGANNDGTQSDIYGINSPRMHACPKDNAIRGWHNNQNDLFCCG